MMMMMMMIDHQGVVPYVRKAALRGTVAITAPP
jgi:hypothetical protein